MGEMFRTIVADPPWTYDDDDPFVGGSWGRLTRNDAASGKYPLLTLADIKTLPVARFAQDDAYLWLWMPSQHFRRGLHLEVLAAWGFDLKAERVWVKEESGVGFWFVYNHEYLILATRGSPGPLEKRGLPSGVRQGRTGPHTTKPERFYRDIEDACAGPYLELFARHPRPYQLDMTRPNHEWTVWGNEVGDPLGIGFDPTEWQKSAPLTSTADQT